MDFLSSLFGWGKEKGPAQLLVLGAELKCPYGSKHSFLLPPLREMAINEMPCGCVKDSNAWENIFPFGDCKEGFSCAEFMDLEEKWENLTPQELQIEGEEVITTDSILMCKKCGVGIEAVTSGQDGVIAGKWIEEARQLYGIEQKYPGLVEIITNAGGSLYLDGDMYKDAINFLEDCVEKNGGEIHIGTLIVPDNLESNVLRILMDLLLPGCDASKPEGYLTVLEERGVATGMYDTPGWDPHLLNAQMIQMLRVDCEQTAEKIRTDPVARFPEEHKKIMRPAAEMFMEFGYGCVVYYATAPGGAVKKRGKGSEKWNKIKERIFGRKGNAGKCEGGSTMNPSTQINGNSYDINKLQKTQPYIDPERVSSIKESIVHNGPNSVPPIEIRVHNGQALVVDGHHRLEAFRQLGYDRVPIKYLHSSQLGRILPDGTYYRSIQELLDAAEISN